MSKIDRLRIVELEILEQFIKICRHENLQWYVTHGTLLGAFRDEGFLLWDDDIDVLMPSHDYIKLMTHKNWFESPYYLQTPLDSGWQNFMKLYKNGTTAFDKSLGSVLKRGGHHGICIDILPLNEIENTEYYCLQNHILPKSYFEPNSQKNFEHLLVNVPNYPCKVLDMLYGYWNWPNGAETPHPHYWFFDTEIDYSVYVKRYTGWLNAAKRKKIFLFGAADSLKIWMTEFGVGKQVICTFDNDNSKWGERVFGTLVRNPDELPKLLDNESILIIVSIWHQEIGKQLVKMGIHDYYVFIDGLFTN